MAGWTWCGCWSSTTLVYVSSLGSPYPSCCILACGLMAGEVVLVTIVGLGAPFKLFTVWFAAEELRPVFLPVGVL